jgi:hypothetical protein
MKTTVALLAFAIALLRDVTAENKEGRSFYRPFAGKLN